jgi:SWI/SNF related-matrix-associated actin-dependent regulator of chromatin subfamily C
MAASLVKEETTGELHLVSAPMKSIDGLILFDRPKCSIRADDIASGVSTSSAPVVANGDADSANLDDKIWERLSEASCSFCSQPLPSLHYESQKEVCAQSEFLLVMLHILMLFVTLSRMFFMQST